MTTLVAEWQEGLDPTSFSDNRLGLAGTLFESCVRLFVDLIRGPVKQALEPHTFQYLQLQAQRFNLWGDGFSASQGELDRILADSDHLRKPVLSFLSALGNTLVELARKSDPDGVSNNASSSPLRESCEQIEILKDQVSKIIGESVDTDGDEVSSSGSEMSSFDDLNELVEDIKTYVDCFMDLVCTLENPAKNSGRGQNPGDALVESAALANHAAWKVQLKARPMPKLRTAVKDAMWRTDLLGLGTVLGAPTYGHSVDEKVQEELKRSNQIQLSSIETSTEKVLENTEVAKGGRMPPALYDRMLRSIGSKSKKYEALDEYAPMQIDLSYIYPSDNMIHCNLSFFQCSYD